jgi:superfamily II DNA or RNA helicase
MIPVTIDSDEKRAWVVGRVPPHVFTALEGLPGRKRYVAGTPYFEPSRSNLEYIDGRLEDVTWRGPAARLVEQFQGMREQEKQAREDRKIDSSTIQFEKFPFKTKPYDHQKKCFLLARSALNSESPCYGLFMEQGTGKTKVILDLTADLYLKGGSKGKIDTLVIIAPNGVHAQWINEQVGTHLSEAVPYRGAYTNANPNPEEKAAMKATLAYKEGLRIFAVHVDSLSHKKGQEFLREVLTGSRALLAVDESSRIKDLNSKRTKYIVNVAKLAPYRLIATGTPVSQGVEDLYSQFYFLNKNILGYDSFFSFRNHFCRMGGYQNKKIVGYVNEDELKAKIDSYTYRVLKDDCLDLPKKNFIRREVLFTTEQRKVYDQMRKDFFLSLDSGVMTARMALTRIIRLQQIVSGFISAGAKKDELGRIVEPAVYQELPNGRADAAVDIIREAQGKVIVWVKFEGDHKLLTRALDAAGIQWVDYVGPTPQKDRKKNIDRFREDPDCKVFISSPKSGGTGLNLTCASEVIWYSRDFSLENELQANDRCHRIGQERVVNYHYLVTPRTVDERIDKLLRGKLSVAENLIDLRSLVDE